MINKWENYNLTDLKKIASAYKNHINIGGVSKLNKSQLIKILDKHLYFGMNGNIIIKSQIRTIEKLNVNNLTNKTKKEIKKEVQKEVNKPPERRREERKVDPAIRNELKKASDKYARREKYFNLKTSVKYDLETLINNWGNDNDAHIFFNTPEVKSIADWIRSHSTVIVPNFISFLPPEDEKKMLELLKKLHEKYTIEKINEGLQNITSDLVRGSGRTIQPDDYIKTYEKYLKKNKKTKKEVPKEEKKEERKKEKKEEKQEEKQIKYDLDNLVKNWEQDDIGIQFARTPEMKNLVEWITKQKNAIIPALLLFTTAGKQLLNKLYEKFSIIEIDEGIRNIIKHLRKKSQSYEDRDLKSYAKNLNAKNIKKLIIELGLDKKYK